MLSAKSLRQSGAARIRSSSVLQERSATLSERAVTTQYVPKNVPSIFTFASNLHNSTLAAFAFGGRGPSGAGSPPLRLRAMSGSTPPLFVMISPMDEPGTDNAGNPYTSAKEMWRLEAGEGDQTAEKQKKEEWYRNGVSYWESVEASVNGVLGGYGHVSSVDIAESEAFLRETYGGRLAEKGDQPLRALG
jgi:hypothetical protein